MRNLQYLLSGLLLLALLAGCAERPATSATDARGEDVFIFGYRGGFGSEAYFRFADGKLYAGRYKHLRSNEPENRFNYDSIATHEGNWDMLADPSLTRQAATLYGEFPAETFDTLPRQACDALAFDGSCPYVGWYRQTSDVYDDWHGTYEAVPAARDFMERVEALVSDLRED
ncbi:hypothetical protein [Neolewinella litorea]|uniref:Uncharacterized protein n=1 Tax=Neolewinella litorea TaxID=2562452 RepID=A0A4S4NJ12_9BACT|nr:hypothetical protein [Neolewinella litorea]THH39752.1 hypothetical protein E4021_09045 [Neolewinella litorea]